MILLGFGNQKNSSLRSELFLENSSLPSDLVSELPTGQLTVFLYVSFKNCLSSERELFSKNSSLGSELVLKNSSLGSELGSELLLKNSSRLGSELGSELFFLISKSPSQIKFQ